MLGKIGINTLKGLLPSQSCPQGLCLILQRSIRSPMKQPFPPTWCGRKTHMISKKILGETVPHLLNHRPGQSVSKNMSSLEETTTHVGQMKSVGVDQSGGRQNRTRASRNFFADRTRYMNLCFLETLYRCLRDKNLFSPNL
jgi:hypothetical protein